MGNARPVGPAQWDLVAGFEADNRACVPSVTYGCVIEETVLGASGSLFVDYNPHELWRKDEPWNQTPLPRASITRNTTALPPPGLVGLRPFRRSHSTSVDAQSVKGVYVSCCGREPIGCHLQPAGPSVTGLGTMDGYGRASASRGHCDHAWIG